MPFAQKAAALVFSAIVAVTAYVILAITSYAVQEVLLGGVSYRTSPESTLIVAAVLTPFCAVLSGLFIGAVGGPLRYWRAAALSALIVAETTYLFSKHLVDGPLWFESGAGLALVVGVFGGTALWGRLRRSQTRR